MKESEMITCSGDMGENDLVIVSCYRRSFLLFFFFYELPFV